MKFLDPYTKEKFWLVHSVIQTHPLEVGIKQVKLHLIARKNAQSNLTLSKNHFELENLFQIYRYSIF